ncbi:TPA: hypothetical protein N0F65_002334 [Lagenidium giganteum]|uniref:Peptidase A1 domain-containing protein n=1 Tax=Lagenidium giganteum TaxID=4803 RepID=A0AAV2Z711_9STRA|nr:TPA: hypothetical protein N0F65_002334 [Lagenidium giganteum]
MADAATATEQDRPRALATVGLGGKIELRRHHSAGGVQRRRRHLKSADPNDVALVNYQGVIYMANITINNSPVLVQVDTGSSDLWVSCAYVDNGQCSLTCPTKSAKIQYGSGTVCVQPTLAPVRFGNISIPNYVVGIAEGPNVQPDSDSSLLLGNAMGLLGLAYSSIATIPTPGGQIIDYMTSFSIYMTARANMPGSFLMINEVDYDLISKYNMTGHSIPLKSKTHWTIGMTGLTIGDNPSVFPCATGSRSSCDALVDTGTSLLVMPTTFFEKFVATYLAPSGCQLNDQVYVCPANIKLPNLGFTFGTSTFYLSSADYTQQISRDEVLVELQQQQAGPLADTWVLGDTFLRMHYTSYVVNESVIFYCTDGNCSGTNGTAAISGSTGNNSQTKSALIIAGVVAGAGLLLALVVMIIQKFCARKRRHNHPDAPNAMYFPAQTPSGVGHV